MAASGVCVNHHRFRNRTSNFTPARGQALNPRIRLAVARPGRNNQVAHDSGGGAPRKANHNDEESQSLASVKQAAFLQEDRSSVMPDAEGGSSSLLYSNTFPDDTSFAQQLKTEEGQVGAASCNPSPALLLQGVSYQQLQGREQRDQLAPQAQQQRGEDFIPSSSFSSGSNDANNDLTNSKNCVQHCPEQPASSSQPSIAAAREALDRLLRLHRLHRSRTDARQATMQYVSQHCNLDLSSIVHAGSSQDLITLRNFATEYSPYTTRFPLSESASGFSGGSLRANRPAAQGSLTPSSPAAAAAVLPRSSRPPAELGARYRELLSYGTPAAADSNSSCSNATTADAAAALGGSRGGGGGAALGSGDGSEPAVRPGDTATPAVEATAAAAGPHSPSARVKEPPSRPPGIIPRSEGRNAGGGTGSQVQPSAPPPPPPLFPSPPQLQPSHATDAPPGIIPSSRQPPTPSSAGRYPAVSERTHVGTRSSSSPSSSPASSPSSSTSSSTSWMPRLSVWHVAAAALLPWGLLRLLPGSAGSRRHSAAPSMPWPLNQGRQQEGPDAKGAETAAAAATPPQEQPTQRGSAAPSGNGGTGATDAAAAAANGAPAATTTAAAALTLAAHGGRVLSAEQAHAALDAVCAAAGEQLQLAGALEEWWGDHPVSHVAMQLQVLRLQGQLVRMQLALWRPVELLNGRLALIGLTSGLLQEASDDPSPTLAHQAVTQPWAVPAAFAAVVLLAAVHQQLQPRMRTRGLLTNPEAQRWLGRAAMLGFMAAVVAEAGDPGHRSVVQQAREWLLGLVMGPVQGPVEALEGVKAAAAEAGDVLWLWW